MSDTQKHTKPNVPNLRFPGFSGEWKKSTVKNECIVNPKTEGLEKEFLYIDLESVVKGQLVKQNIISRDEAPSRAQRVLSKWDIIYQCVRPYQLNNYIIRDDSTIQRVASTGYAQIRTKHNPDFIYQLLHTKGFTDQVINRCTGTNYPAINSSDLSGIEIHFPSIQEQAQIGELLTLIDQRISIQSKLIEDLKKLKTALCDRLYNESTPNCRIGDIIEQLSARNKDGNTQNVLSVSNRYGFISQAEQFEERSIASEDTTNYKVVRLNDFAYNPARINVGSIARLKSIEKGIVSPMYICFRCGEVVLPEFLEQFFSTKFFSLEVGKRLEGSVRMCLSFEGLCNIPISLPSLVQQKGISEKINCLNKKFQIEENYLFALLNQKQYLLSHLFI